MKVNDFFKVKSLPPPPPLTLSAYLFAGAGGESHEKNPVKCACILLTFEPNNS